MKAWIGQRLEQVTKLGAKAAPWYCFWREPAGRLRKRSCGIGPAGKRAAKDLAERLHIELATGRYEGLDGPGRRLGDFAEEYLKTLRGRSRIATVVSAERALTLFREFLGDSRRLSAIGPREIDEFVSRRLSPGNPGTGSPGKAVTRATVNSNLRVLKAALRMAAERGYILQAPRVRMLKLEQRTKTFISPEQFSALYAAADQAARPVIRNVSPGDWWRGLLVFAWLTGWRIGQILALRVSDLDLDRGTATTRASDNKGGRDQMIALHPLIIEKARPLIGSFDPLVFPWPHGLRCLWYEFAALQESAKLPLAGKGGGRFGFHDLRRGFATLNAGRLTAFQLQHLMQHRSMATTQEYVALGNPILDATEKLIVPDLGKAGG